MKQEFEGYALIGGDDPHCFGAHALMRDEPHSKHTKSDIIDFIDGFFERNKDKKLHVSIEIKILEDKNDRQN